MNKLFPCLLLCMALGGCVAEESNVSDSFDPEPIESPAADSSDDNTPQDLSVYKVKFETSTGDFTIEVHPDWAPLGAERFKELVEAGYYDDCRFFRVVKDFMVQFGLNGDPSVTSQWRSKNLKDDPVTQSNTRGKITFATAGPNTRTTQVFINFGNNSFLDGQGFAPFGEVVEGMDVVDSINNEYGESPNQGSIQQRGNEYLNAQFPKLDYVKKASIVE